MAVVPDARPSKEALCDLKARLIDALRDHSPVDSPDLAAELIEVADLATWCRDAGLAWVRTGSTWDEIARSTGVSYRTLHSRYKVWYERGGTEECDG